MIAVAPHGDVESVPELRAAMEELGRRYDGGSTAVVVTPHNVHVEGHFAVAVSARVGEHVVDRELALRLVDAIRAEGLPIVGVSYGGNDPAGAELPLDWGTEVPLRYVARRGWSSSRPRATARSTSTSRSAVRSHVPQWYER